MFRGKRHVQEGGEEGETQEVVKVQKLRRRGSVSPEENCFLTKNL